MHFSCQLIFNEHNVRVWGTKNLNEIKTKDRKFFRLLHGTLYPQLKILGRTFSDNDSNWIKILGYYVMTMLLNYHSDTIFQKWCSISLFRSVRALLDQKTHIYWFWDLNRFRTQHSRMRSRCETIYYGKNYICNTLNANFVKPENSILLLIPQVNRHVENVIFYCRLYDVFMFL